MTQPATYELLPCPFCGSADVDVDGTACEFEGKNGFQATCASCHATGPESLDEWHSAYNWNMRAKR